MPERIRIGIAAYRTEKLVYLNAIVIGCIRYLKDFQDSGWNVGHFPISELNLSR